MWLLDIAINSAFRHFDSKTKMADQQSLKTFVVKRMFSIPDWYVMSEYKEDKLIHKVVDHPTSFEQAHLSAF